MSLDISKFQRIVVFSPYPGSREKWTEFIHPLYIHDDKETFQKLMHRKELGNDTLFIIEDSDIRQHHHFQTPNILYATPRMLIGKPWMGAHLQLQFANDFSNDSEITL